MEHVRFEKLNKENFSEVLKIKKELFPESESEEDYLDYFENKRACEYFLVYCNKSPCGITGWYDFDGNGENAFMGWFGVLSQFRRNGIGSQIFDFTVKCAEKKKYNYFRLYTDKVVNAESIKFYENKRMNKEDYTYYDNLGKTGRFLVFTKILNSNGKDKWNNRPLNEDFNYVDLN